MLLRLLLAALASTISLTSCGDDGTDPGQSSAGARHVVGWSESQYDADVLLQVGEPDRLIRTAEELDEFVDLASSDLDVTALRGVDIDDVVLVVGSYPRCMETSTVEVAADGSTVRFVVVPPDDEVVCSWAPLQVDVWSVDRADVADDVRLAER